MTISTDSTPDDATGKGTALDIIPEATTGIDPFTPRAEAPAPRGLRARMLDYSAHAAMIVGLLGFAWTVGDHVVHRPTPAADAMPAAVVAVAPAPVDPMTELRDRNRELAANVQALQARLDALQTSVGDQGKVAAQVRVLQAGLDSVKTGLGATRSEQSAAVSRLDGKIEKLAQQHEPASKMQQLVDRLGKLERGTVDISPTASLPHPAEAKVAEAKITNPRTADARTADVKPAPVPRPNDLKVDPALAGADEPGKLQIITAWVVRDVYDGVALLEGRRGTLEVVPGVSIPGAGIVKSIERHGSGWTVTTTKGLVASAAAAPRDNRRAERAPYGGYYGPNYRYDF